MTEKFRLRFNLPQLNYTVCTDGHLGEIYNNQLVKSFWDGHKDTDLMVGQQRYKEKHFNKL